MATIALFGASGLTGRLTAAELVRRGHHTIAAAPDGDRLRARLDVGDEAMDVLELRGVDAEDASALDALASDVDLVIDLAGPYAARGRTVVEAALRAGIHHVDAALEPDFVGWVHNQHERARVAGSVLVPAGGFPGALLDLLASSVVGAVTGADEVHLATGFPSRGGPRRGAGPATRAVLAELLGRPMVARVAGEAVEEPVAEARRLAWFPRPVGLAHAAGVPGAARLSVPRHAPDIGTVREYLALPGWQAELLQLAGAATGWPWARRRISRLVEGGPGEPSVARRSRVRWACVAETRGAEGVARAWANGRDPAATTAAALVVLAEAILAGAGSPGVRVPGELGRPGELLDRLSARRELRWSVIRPG